MGYQSGERIVVASEKIAISNQQKEFASRTVNLSLIFLLVLGVFLLLIFIVFPLFGISTPFVTIAPIWFLYYLIPLFLFISTFFTGYKHRIIVHPPDIPFGFFSYDAVYNSLRRKRIETFSRRNALNARILRALFTNRSDFLVNPIKNRLQGILGFFFLFMFMIGINLFFYAVALLTGEVGFNEVIFFYVLLIAYLVFFILFFREIVGRIIPTIIPQTNVHYELQEYSGSHPGKLHRNLSTLLEKVNYDYPRRFRSWSPQLDSSVVDDTGTTYGNHFIESVPKNVKRDPYIKGMRLALNASFVVGALILVSPAFLRFDEDFFFPFFFYSWFLYVIMFSFLSLSRVLATSYFWESKMIFAEFMGEFYRSNIGVGTSTDDSLKSERLSIISEVTIRYYGSRVVSQSVGLESPREIIAMDFSDDIPGTINHLSENIEVEKQAVDIQMPNLEHHNVQRLSNINLRISQARDMGSSRPPEAYLGGSKKRPLMLPQQASKKKPSEFIVCSSCNAKLAPQSLFCNICGQKMIKKEPKKTEDMINCPHCRGKMEAGSAFCKNCGQKVTQEPVVKKREEASSKLEYTGYWVCFTCNKINEGEGNICMFCGKRQG